MVNRSYVLDIMKSKHTSIEEFNWDKLWCPPIAAMFTQQDIWNLKRIATSIKYSAKPQLKYQEIDKIMNSRGFVKLSAGTNRICYKCVENDTFVVKVAYDAVGMNDNPREFANQFLLKPFCTKVFEVAGDGVIATVERVKPITSREEYITVASDVFTLINEWIIGEYVMEDIGTQFFMNIGIRVGFGVVLLDFPFLYKLDGKKLFCVKPDPASPTGACDGEIDYDDGFNFLYCKKCGARYRAREVAVEIENNNIVLKEKGDKRMKINLKGGSHNISTSVVVEEGNNDVKAMPVGTINKTGGTIKVSLNRPKVVEEPIPTAVNGVPEAVVEPEKEEEKVIIAKEEVKAEENITEVKKEEPKPEKKEAPVVEKKPANKKEVTSPIHFDNEKKLSEYDELKRACNDVSKFLSLILNGSGNNKAHAKKLVCELIEANIDKVSNLFTDSQLGTISDVLFLNEGHVLNVILESGDTDNDTTYMNASITNNSGLPIASNSVAYIEFKTVDDEGAEYQVEEVNNSTDDLDAAEPLTDVEYFEAVSVDIKEIFADRDSEKVLLIKDNVNDAYLNVGDNKLLAIKQIDNKEVNTSEIVAADYIESLIKTIDSLSEQVSEYEEDNSSAEEYGSVEEVDTDDEDTIKDEG